MHGRTDEGTMKSSEAHLLTIRTLLRQGMIETLNLIMRCRETEFNTTGQTDTSYTIGFK